MALQERGPDRDHWSPIRLGAALRVARQALGLTQAELALAAGVGLRFVVELEAGKPTVRLQLHGLGTQAKP